MARNPLCAGYGDMCIADDKIKNPKRHPVVGTGARGLEEEVEIEVKVPAFLASGKKGARKALRGMRRLRNLETGEWVEVSRLRKITL